MKAAEKRHKEAQFNLGNICYKGKGVQQDYVKANKWYILSSNQNHTEAIQARDRMRKEMNPENISEAEKHTNAFKVTKDR